MLKKKFLSIFLSIFLFVGLFSFTTSIYAATTKTRNLYYGDMNMDKEITLSDVLMLAKEVLNEQNNAMADANRDGKASLADVMFVAKFVMDGKIRPPMVPLTFDITSNEPKTALLYYNEYDKSIARFETDQTLSLRFYATAPFNGLDIQMVDAGTARFSLYKWHQSYQVSKMSKPVYSEEKSFGQWEQAQLQFAEQPVYEYLLCIEKVEGNISVQTEECDENMSLLYTDGRNMETWTMVSQIHYTKTPAKLNSVVTYRDDIPYVFPEGGEPADAEILSTRDVMPDTWVCTDGLNRTVSTNAQTGDVKKDKVVGLFYWSWHVEQAASPWSMTNNNEEILGAVGNDESKVDWNLPELAGNHFWGESIFGYYRTCDEFVLRKHAEMLAAAGVDVIFFDNTNVTSTFKDSYEFIFKVFDQARKDGVKTPKISFMLPLTANDYANEQVKRLYYDIYQKGRYQDLWFYWEGKPMLLAHEGSITGDRTDEAKAIANFFTWRGGTASYHGAGKDIWTWCNIYPQDYCGNEDGTVEQVSVNVAQNYVPGLETNWMSNPDVFNRAYTDKNGYSQNVQHDMLYGLNFAEQWERALSLDPEMIFITGWNEWIVGNQGGIFVDQYAPWASRDIEPSKGVLKDHYYYQMVDYIRKFKGTRAVPEATDKKTIDIYAEQDQWSDVGPNYLAYQNNTQHRDEYGYYDKDSFVPGVGGTERVHYVNTTGRNDITNAKVAHDDNNIYFMVETKSDLTPSSDPAWMQLYLDIGESEQNWETFEYMVNRINPQERAYLERSTGGWNWKNAGEVEYSVSGNRLQIKIPKSLLGITGDEFTINFKWTDNADTKGDIMNFYENGDVAPLGRFKFQYNA